MEIRSARPEEYAAVAGVVVAAYDPFLLGEDDGYLDRLRDSEARAREAVLLVAAEEGRVLGSVTYTPAGSPWRELARDGEGEFRMLAVAPAAQGRGIGDALVRECELRARADGATGMVLCSLEEMTAAHRLYGRLGYRRDPARDWTADPDVSLIAFAKEL